MFSPIMPFVTEEIYQTNYRKIEKIKSIHLCKWPENSKKPSTSIPLALFYNILIRIRREKTLAKKSMNSEIILTIEEKEQKEIKEMLEDLKSVTNAKEVKSGPFNVEFI